MSVPAGRSAVDSGPTRRGSSCARATIVAHEGPARHPVVTQGVPELAELVEDDVGRVLFELVAGVVDLLDVALGAIGSDDVVGMGNPAVEPLETFAAHPLGQYRDPAATHDRGDGHPTTGVVTRRRPDRAARRRVELARHDRRHQAAVRGQHLVGVDHGKPVTQRQHNPGVDTREFRRQFDVVRHLDAIASTVVVPVDPEQVPRVGPVAVDAAEASDHVGGHRGWVGELGHGWQPDAVVAEPGHGTVSNVSVDQIETHTETHCCCTWAQCVHVISISPTFDGWHCRGRSMASQSHPCEELQQLVGQARGASTGRRVRGPRRSPVRRRPW